MGISYVPITSIMIDPWGHSVEDYRVLKAQVQKLIDNKSLVFKVDALRFSVSTILE